ncbi:MAG TPA: restriction endonuclease [Novosphingobium sp.]|nr:restriction endonuclease [Novosphingobium sp.]
MSATPLFDPIQPAQTRYIKLGRGGAWERRSLDEGLIYWSNNEDPVEEAAAGDWDTAEQRYRDYYANRATATGTLRELQDFFTLGSDTLWITFAFGQMWWAFSEPAQAIPGVADLTEPAAFRRTIGPWRNVDRFGIKLDQNSLSTKLTQLAAYRRSICAVKHVDYAVRRINGEREANAIALGIHRRALIEASADIIRDLHWRDFELLVDLIFSGAGWRRLSEVGGTMKDIDLLLEQPITREIISVQVKSAINQSVADECVAAFAASTVGSRFFIVYHTGTVAPRSGNCTRPVHLWDCLTLAEHAVDAGLTNWLAAHAG